MTARPGRWGHPQHRGGQEGHGLRVARCCARRGSGRHGPGLPRAAVGPGQGLREGLARQADPNGACCGLPRGDPAGGGRRFQVGQVRGHGRDGLRGHPARQRHCGR
eukprot:7927883-Pyramimonas_sp.AAC.1